MSNAPSPDAVMRVLDLFAGARESGRYQSSGPLTVGKAAAAAKGAPTIARGNIAKLTAAALPTRKESTAPRPPDFLSSSFSRSYTLKTIILASSEPPGTPELPPNLAATIPASSWLDDTSPTSAPENFTFTVPNSVVFASGILVSGCPEAIRLSVRKAARERKLRPGGAP